MGWQIVKQPNDLWAIWTTIADGFILEDATEEELVDFWGESQKEAGRRLAMIWIEDIKSGYRCTGYDYEYCMRVIEQVHGDGKDEAK
jgi:hypothetical protein